MALLFGLMSLALYSLLIERQYRSLQRSPRDLFGPTSTILTTEDGIDIHMTRENPPRGDVKAFIHCLHGFGSHTFSYSFVQKQLAQRLQAVVTAHDMPGFGLSSRPNLRKAYTMKFNGRISSEILDQEEKKAISTYIDAKKVLIGHSMGASAVAEAIIGNDNVDAAILIAPAIIALWTRPRVSNKQKFRNGIASFLDSLVETEDPIGREPVVPSGSSVARLGYRLGYFLRGLISLFQGIASEIFRLLFAVLAPAVQIFMHALIFPREFWRNGLTVAWADQSRVTKEYIDAYRLPVLIKGWEKGILKFIDGRIAEKTGILHAITQFLHPERTMLQAERLRDACCKKHVPLLIVHGVNDIIVPYKNSKKLHESIPESKLVIFDNCGHMPHEELPEDFVKEVDKFIQDI